MNYQLKENISLLAGLSILVLGSPVCLMGLSIAIWEFIDRGFRGAPATGFIFSLAKKINQKTQQFNERFVNNKQDAYMINVIIFQAFIIPIMFTYCLFYTMKYGFNLYLCFIYNLIRVGPYMVNFAYAYTLCHKESHTGQFIYKEPYNLLFSNIFNWYVGLFYGILPQTFAIGHCKNHHKYNNKEPDVITTADRPRDNIINWIKYLTRFTLYSINVSTIIQFYKEKGYKNCINMLVGNMYYLTFFCIGYKASQSFALGFIFYPLFENIILLSAINWSWHAFMDPEDPNNEYVYSITLKNGTFNVLEEDLHVVHHQYPGAHWTKHTQLYEKHKQEYIEKDASMFEEVNAIDVFLLIILRQYGTLAKKFITKRQMTYEEKVQMIKKRVRACSWGALKNTKDKIQ